MLKILYYLVLFKYLLSFMHISSMHISPMHISPTVPDSGQQNVTLTKNSCHRIMIMLMTGIFKHTLNRLVQHMLDFIDQGDVGRKPLNRIYLILRKPICSFMFF